MSEESPMVKELQNIYDESVKPLDEFPDSQSNIFNGLEYTKLFNKQYVSFINKINIAEQKYLECGYLKEVIKIEADKLHVMIVKKS